MAFFSVSIRMLIPLFLLASVACTGTEANAQITQLTAEKASLERDNSSLKAQLADLKGQLTEAQRANTELVGKFGEASKSIALLQQDKEANKKTIADMQLQLNNARATLDSTKASLDAALAELAALKAPPLVARDAQLLQGTVHRDQRISYPVELKAFEQLQGEVVTQGRCDMPFYIQDPAGAMVRDFGRITQTNFQFTAKAAGTYSLVMAGVYSDCDPQYKLRYTLYAKQ